MSEPTIQLETVNVRVERRRGDDRAEPPAGAERVEPQLGLDLLAALRSASPRRRGARGGRSPAPVAASPPAPTSRT